MKALFPILLIIGAMFAHASAPIPYAGKLSVDQINYSGSAKFSFEILDANAVSKWKSGAGMIQVPVARGRYLVLLGGQGMHALPTELFHQDVSLSLRVRVELGDGQGIRLLSPDVAISTAPRALAAEIAKLADRAITASIASPGSITKDAFSASTQSQYGRLFNPNISEFSIDGLTPIFDNSGDSLAVRKGESLTLTAPSAQGANLTYQWKRNGQLIEGANQPSLQITADEAVYTVTASNALGSTEAKITTFSSSRIDPQSFNVWNSTYYIDSNLNLWGLGANFYGKIGLEDTDSSFDPVLIAEGVRLVSGNDNFAVFIKTDGTLWGMGRNHYGQLGDGTNSSHRIPFQITKGEILSAVAGQDHTLFVKYDGSLWGMGSNAYGQLGIKAEIVQSTPIKVFESGVKAVSAGEGFSFVLMTSGELRSFGRNHYGQLGNDSVFDTKQSQVIFQSGVKDVSCGNLHTVVLLDDGSLWTMGENERGQLGSGGFDDSAKPVKVVGSDVVSIDSGYQNSYFLKTNGELWGMGANRDGQLGVLPNETTDARSNQPVKIVSEVTEFSSGGWSLIYTRNDGKLFGLGYTGWAQFGIKESYFQFSPQKVNVSGVERIEVTHDTNAIWLQNNVFSVSGSNEGSKLMLGHDTAKISNFVKSNFETPRSYSGGSEHALLVDNNGSLWAIGDNSWGRLGISEMKTIEPIKVVNGGVKSVHSRSQTFFIKEDGSLWGMGRNDYGQLGNGNNTDQTLPVKTVDANVTQVVTVSETTMFLKTDGSVWTMGSNKNGKLGIGEVGGGSEGSYTSTNLPTKIVGNGITQIAMGNSACYFLGKEGSLWAFGSKNFGQLGERKVADRHFPIQIIKKGVIEVSAYGHHVVFVKADGSLWGMGRNHRGQLGNDQYSEISFPVQIMSSNVKSAKTGAEHTLVLMQDGSLFSFGSDIAGQLAIGRTIGTEKPVLITEDLLIQTAD